MKVQHDFMWAMLVHLGTNMWYEPWDKGHEAYTQLWEIPGSYEMRLDKAVWDRYMEYLKASGVNTLVIDLGDGIIYDSHPELAIKGSWTKAEMKKELNKLNDMGFEVIPKLNFSSCHDAWMKEYSRMLSTPTYYKVCEDLINEVCELFDYPRYFHIGFDEEDYETQKNYSYVVVRQNELWWSDLLKIISAVEKNNARAIMWSDYMRFHPEEYLQKCPKSVLTCNWYYGNNFVGERTHDDEVRLKPYELLDKHGFDQLPGGSISMCKENFENLTEYCSNIISKEHFKGMLQTTWTMVTEEWWEPLKLAADLLAETRKSFENK